MNQDQFQPFLSALTLGGVLINASGAILGANAAAEELSGRPAAKLCGESFFDIFPDAGDENDAKRSYRDGIARGVVVLAYLSSVNGTRIKAHVKLIGGVEPPAALALLEAIPAEDTLRHAVANLEARLRRVGTIRHEINNLMMGLMGHIELLEGTPDIPDWLKERASKMREQTHRTREQVQELAEVVKGSKGRVR